MNLREFSAALRVARHYSGSDAGEEAVERLNAAFAEMLLEKAEVARAARAVVEAWEQDEIGQVDGDLISRLAKLVGVELAT